MGGPVRRGWVQWKVGDPLSCTVTPPPTIPQLKVPAEEPATELPMNEIEAWKAAEKVGSVCP
jgi:hypothetical protein